MKYTLQYTHSFKKDVLICQKRGLNLCLLEKAITELANNGILPASYKPHKLKGEYNGCWECHIQPDWLLIWQQNDKELILILTNTGTHSDLFR